MNNLHVSIGHNGSAVSYSPQDFLTIKQNIQDTLKETIEKEHGVNQIMSSLLTHASTRKDALSTHH